jgi:hypothetical protein
MTRFLDKFKLQMSGLSQPPNAHPPPIQCREGSTCSERSQWAPLPWHYFFSERSDTEAHPELVCPDSPPFQLHESPRRVLMVSHMDSKAPECPMSCSTPIPPYSRNLAQDCSGAPVSWGPRRLRALRFAGQLVPGIHDIELPSRIRPRSLS